MERNNKVLQWAIAITVCFSAQRAIISAKKNGKNGNGDGSKEMVAPPAAKSAAKSGHGFTCTDLKSSEDFNLSTEGPTVALFYSNTCSMCDLIKKPFNAFVEHHKGSISCMAIDVDNPAVKSVVEPFKIEGVPTTVVIHKLVGAIPDAQQFEQALSRMTGLPPVGAGTRVEEAGEEISSARNASRNQNPEDEDEIESELDFRVTETPLVVTPEEIGLDTSSEKAPMEKPATSKASGASKRTAASKRAAMSKSA